MNEIAPVTASRTNVLALLDSDPETMRMYLFGGESVAHDRKLQILTTRLGTLAGALSDAGWTKNNLRSIYGYTAGWLAGLGALRVQTLVNAERDRQDALFVEGKITFNCASNTVAQGRKLRVLVEEIGEVAEAIDKLEAYVVYTDKPQKAGEEKRRDHLVEELVQVAAVCVAWLESMEGKP